MPVAFSIVLAIRAIGRHPLRSGLTLVGISIGVAVVIVMVGIATGARRAIEQHVQAAGATLIHVRAGNYSPGDLDPSSGDVAEPAAWPGGADGPLSGLPVRAARTMTSGEGWVGMAVSPRVRGRGASTAFTVADVDVAGRDVSGIRWIAANVTETAVVVAGRARFYGRLQGTTEAYPEIRAFTLRDGRFFTARQVERREAVVVLSSAASAALFGAGVNPVGRSVEIRRTTFTVAGVVDRPGGFQLRAGELDEVYLPYTALQDRLGITHLHGATVSIARAGESTRVARDLTVLLRDRHGLGPEEPDDFTVRTQAREAVLGKGVNPLLARAVAGSVVNLDQVTLEQMAMSLERSSRTMTALLASVAGVSLIVGGIGIMNIMLVAVTERTREIGLRMAVGARARDVLAQFLTEAVALSVAGGLIGVAIGLGTSGSVGGRLRWAVAVSPGSIAVAVGAAAAVGVFFGFYPARLASRLDPIEAIRCE